MDAEEARSGRHSQATPGFVADSPVAPGAILAGRYRVERILGAGGMGVVVAARHVQLESAVAIKFLLPHALSNPEVVARFAREARAAVRIQSEHVARVIDVGALETGAPYMVMEYLQGCDLAALVGSRGALPIGEAADYILQACEAIAEAHSLGIVHRDLKPANLFLIGRPDGSSLVKVLDFGISKTLGSSSAAMTGTMTVLGSPYYMSPEHMSSSKNVDHRTDIWALGAILHELLTGQVPFKADTLAQLCLMVVQQPPPRLRSLRPDAPPGLEALIRKCLEKDRDRRFPHVGDFALALGEFAPARSRVSVERAMNVLCSRGNAIDASQTDPSTYYGGTQSLALNTAAWGHTKASPAAGSGKWIAGAAAILMLGAGGGGFWLMSTRRAPAPTTASSSSAANSSTPREPCRACQGSATGLGAGRKYARWRRRQEPNRGRWRSRRCRRSRRRWQSPRSSARGAYSRFRLSTAPRRAESGPADRPHPEPSPAPDRSRRARHPALLLPAPSRPPPRRQPRKIPGSWSASRAFERSARCTPRGGPATDCAADYCPASVKPHAGETIDTPDPMAKTKLPPTRAIDRAPGVE